MAELESFQVFNSINEEPKENNFSSVNDITGRNQDLINLPNNFDQTQVSNTKNDGASKNALEGIETNGEELERKLDAIKTSPFNNQPNELALEANPMIGEPSVPLKEETSQKSDTFVADTQYNNVDGTMPTFRATQNSINLIQQGNSFMPMQKLTSEQMAQVIAVVQQKKIEQQNLETSVNNIDSAGHRLAYKITIPRENNNLASLNTNMVGDNLYAVMHNHPDSFQLGGMQKKVSTGATDVRMRMEKDRKKKHRPRTRSGRISKPPKTVVKDYVRLHQLDYEEDYDDSDGGYSDYKMSSGEEEEEKSKFSFKETSVLSSSSGKSKSFKCETCDKSYIGQAGLNRHYRLQPTHGKPDDEGANEMGELYYSSDSQSGISHFKVQTTSTGGALENKKNDEGLTLSMEVDGGERSGDGSSDIMGRRGRRARVAGSLGGGLYDVKKKQKLIEAIKGCSDDDILDVFLQKCASSISIWKLLMAKTTKVYDSSIDSLISEVSNLNEQLSTYLSDKLVPFNEDDDDLDTSGHAYKNVFEMVDERMATCLNIELGKYIVRVDEYLEGSVQAEEPTIYQTSNHPPSPNDSYSPRAISLPLRKRLKMTADNEDEDALKPYVMKDDGCEDRDVDVEQQQQSGGGLATTTATNHNLPASNNQNLLNAFSDLIKPNKEQQQQPNSLVNISNNNEQNVHQQEQLQQLHLERQRQLQLQQQHQSQQQLIQKQLQQQQLQHLLSQQQQQQQQQASVTCYQLQEQIHVDENSLYVRMENNTVVVKNADNSYQIYGELNHELTLEFLESLFTNHTNN